MSTSYFLYTSHSISERESSFGERNMCIMFQRHQSHITLAAMQDDIKLSIVVVLVLLDKPQYYEFYNYTVCYMYIGCFIY
jgi:hypothetical protein